ncbi:hypothetical protein GIB67_017343, partial [Kingdonia uniflora]
MDPSEKFQTSGALLLGKENGKVVSWSFPNRSKCVLFFGGCLKEEVVKEIVVKDIIMKNPKSKYLYVDHDPLTQVFGPGKKGWVNFMGLDIYAPLLREEIVVHFLNIHEHIITTGRALVLPGLQESQEAEYEVI